MAQQLPIFIGKRKTAPAMLRFRFIPTPDQRSENPLCREDVATGLDDPIGNRTSLDSVRTGDLASATRFAGCQPAPNAAIG
jgi:hypothetical protein